MGENPVRRMRVQFFSDHNPKVWAAYYEPPGMRSCYCHAPTLDEMWKALEDYFKGSGFCPPLRVEDRLMRYLEPRDHAAGREALSHKGRG